MPDPIGIVVLWSDVEAALAAAPAEPAAATEIDVERLEEALHYLHSVEMWRWWEPQPDGGALVRKGTSPEFATAILSAYAGLVPHASAAMTRPPEALAAMPDCLCDHRKESHYFGDALGPDGQMHTWCQLEPTVCRDYRPNYSFSPNEDVPA